MQGLMKSQPSWCVQLKPGGAADVGVYVQSVQGVLVQAVALMSLDKVHCRQHDCHHDDGAKEALIANNFEGSNVKIGHEVVLEGDLGSLHGLQTRAGDSCWQAC